MKVRETKNEPEVEVLSVAELIEELLRLPPDAPVRTEGCDCSAFAVGVELLPPDRIHSFPVAYIRRLPE